MRKIIVTTHVTLDGVMQAALSSEEDPSEGFNYGGWAAPSADAMSGRAIQKEMNKPVDYLLGRKTFEIFAAYWPKHATIWPGINTGTKYVLSKTIKTSDWNNTVFLQSLNDIQQLKHSEGADIQVWGSSELIHLLLENGLVDELHLRIFPILLGKGKKLFDNGTIPTAFTLTEHIVTTKGVIIAQYKRAEELFPTEPVQTLIDRYLNR
ncbi:dihydrofolate reductase [Spirosoma sp. HMF4905]|uniref:Dihydrofolate reductase n=1 Tax=Spirosoma arboris TaxID=2682092 RepID=A0A7K1SAU1_9BACT|nr:dihydrofolate reductase family protein [Spirosoma arboris]MVM30953.1 dihydrofolate reductase [Spirosoma arboris]